LFEKEKVKTRHRRGKTARCRADQNGTWAMTVSREHPGKKKN